MIRRAEQTAMTLQHLRGVDMQHLRKVTPGLVVAVRKAEDPWEVGTREESSTRMHRYTAMLSQMRISEAEDYLRESFEPLLAEIMEAGYSPEKQSALEAIVAGAIEEFIWMIRNVEQTRSAAGFLGRGMDMMQHLRSATPGIVAAVRMEMSSKRD